MVLLNIRHYDDKAHTGNLEPMKMEEGKDEKKIEAEGRYIFKDSPSLGRIFVFEQNIACCEFFSHTSLPIAIMLKRVNGNPFANNNKKQQEKHRLLWLCDPFCHVHK